MSPWSRRAPRSAFMSTDRMLPFDCLCCVNESRKLEKEGADAKVGKLCCSCCWSPLLPVPFVGVRTPSGFLLYDNLMPPFTNPFN